MRDRVLGASEKGNVDDLVAEVTLVMLLIQAIVVARVMILLPLVRFNQQGLRTSGRWAFLAYFAGLGLGFILIEIVLLQRLSLFLGQPIYTFSVVPASLLIFAGTGPYLANRIQKVSYHTLSYALLAVVGSILITLVLTPPILSLTLGLALRPIWLGEHALLPCRRQSGALPDHVASVRHRSHPRTRQDDQTPTAAASRPGMAAVLPAALREVAPVNKSFDTQVVAGIAALFREFYLRIDPVL